MSQTSVLLLTTLLVGPPVAWAAAGGPATLPRALEPAGGLDWPHLRGPSYTGVSAETGIADSWPTGGPPVLWRIELGQGYSAIIAVGSKLYTQTQTRSGQYVACLDAETGQRLWRHRYEWPWEPSGDHPGPRATPTCRDGRVYFAGAFGTVGCLDAETGRSVWSVNVTKKFKGLGTEYGYACSPLVEEGKVFLPVGGEGASVVALDARDGSVVWRTGSEQASYSPAYPITVGGQRQIVTFLRNVLAAFDPATGRQLWEDRWSESYDEHSSWPVYAEPYLLACAAFRGGARVLELKAGAPPRRVWASRELSCDIFSSLILDGHVYGFDLHDFQPRGTRPARGRFKCVELATGKARWATDRTGHAMALAADGKLILFNEGGELILARATPEKYEELGRTRVFQGEVCWTQPTLSRGRLYVRNQKEAACLFLGAPELLAAELAKARPGTAQGPGLLDELLKSWEGPSLDAPTLRDMLRWYGFCLAPVFVGASGIAFVLWLRARLAGPRFGLRAGRFFFYALLFTLGGLGTFFLSRLRGSFTFTWPVCLFAAYQLTLMAALGGRKGGRRAGWLARAVVLLFAALCYLYYVACERLFVPMGFGFLVGLLPAFPVAAWVAWRMVSRRGFLSEIAWSAVSFSVYYWASALFTVWWT